MSLLLAYAWLWPNQTVLLMGIIPFKIKYLGWYEMAWWAVSFFRGGFPTKVCLVLGLAGFGRSTAARSLTGAWTP